MQDLLVEFKDWFKSDDGMAIVIAIFSIVFVTLLLNYIWKKIHTKLAKQFGRTKNIWDDSLWASIGRPIGVVIWIYGIILAASLLELPAMQTVLSAMQKLTLIFAIVWSAIRFISKAEKNVLKQPVEDEQEQPDVDTVHAISKLLRASVIITGVLISLEALGYSVSAVLAFGGISGIAVGFAAKDLLSNFFGGLMVFMDKPFKVGDWIKSPDRNIEGTVEYIGWRQTRIRTFDKRPLYVPNSTFTSIAVENPSRMHNRRIYETIGLRYGDADKVQAVVEDVKTMLQNHQDIDNDQTLIVAFNGFNASSLDFFVYTFTKTVNWIEFHTIKQDVMLKIINIVHQHDADFAFPTRTVHWEQNPLIPQEG